MKHLLRAALALLVALLIAPGAAAQGLVQLRLSGSLDVERGHLVEIEIASANPAHQLVLHVHLSAGTTGAELGQLVAKRAERAGLSVIAPNPRGDAASIWIDEVSHVYLRLGGGLTGDIACAEGAPSLVRVLPPSAIPEKGEVFMTGSSAVVVQGRPPIRKRAELVAAVEPTMDAPQTATAIWKAAADDWMSERPGTDAWRPIKLAGGGVLTGLSARVEGAGDWRLEVTLEQSGR